MWTGENRRKQKQPRPRVRQGYKTDVSDQEWKLTAPLLPVQRTGRPRKVDLRAVINALR